MDEKDTQAPGAAEDQTTEAAGEDTTPAAAEVQNEPDAEETAPDAHAPQDEAGPDVAGPATPNPAADEAEADQATSDEPAPTDEEQPTGAEPEDGSAVLPGEERGSESETETTRLRAMVEAAVYITDEPLTAKQMAEALEKPVDQVQEVLDSLVAEYEQATHGIWIREVAEGYKMGTKPEHHEAMRAFVKKLQKPLKLSMAALETLAVVAYRQPITAPEIMEIRGVQGAGVLKTLLDRKLIATAGRKNVIGKPMLYKTTKDFLVQFGLKNLKELPTLKEFEELARAALSEGEEPEAEEPAEQSLELPFSDAAGEGEAADSEEGAAEPAGPEEDATEAEPASDPEAPAEPKKPQSETGEAEEDDSEAERRASSED